MVSWRDCEETMRLAQKRIVEEQYKGKYLFSIKQPIYSDDHCRGIVIMSMDITDRKLTEQREQKMLAVYAEEQKAKMEAEEALRRAISIFAGSIAHDLRTPLTSMLIMTDLFSMTQRSPGSSDDKQPLSEEALAKHTEYVQTFLAKLKSTIKEMSQSIDLTLKSMKRLATGTLSHEDFSVCDIEESLSLVLSKYPFVDEQKNKITLNIQDHFSFFACPILFYRIIFNLISNALAQIEKNGRGKITITAEKQDKMNILKFRDTAGGAPPDVVAHFFDGYYTTKKEGTGVGLAFCKLTMQSFGGDLTCESVEGEYIEFILSFPHWE